MNDSNALGGERQEIGPLVEAGDHVDGLEFLGMPGDGRAEVPLNGGDRIEPRLGEHEFVELVPCRAHGDERRLDPAAGGRVDGVDVPVEHDRADHVRRGDREHL
jgi:hypothetical protein